MCSHIFAELWAGDLHSMEQRGIGFPRSTDDLDARRRIGFGIRTTEEWNGVVWRRGSNTISRPFVKRLFLVWCEYHATTPRYAGCGFHLYAPIFLGSGVVLGSHHSYLCGVETAPYTYRQGTAL